MSIFKRTRNGVGWLITASVIGGSAFGLSVPKAEASPLSFIQALNEHGLVVYDTATALRTGYAICETLNTHDGVDVTAAVYALFSDIRTPAGAWAMVESSVTELCPWHDHRGQLA